MKTINFEVTCVKNIDCFLDGLYGGNVQLKNLTYLIDNSEKEKFIMINKIVKICKFIYIDEDIPDDCFKNVSFITIVKLGPHCKKIGERAFSASSIYELLLSDGLREIKKDAFKNATFYQENLYFPGSLYFVGNQGYKINLYRDNLNVFAHTKEVAEIINIMFNNVNSDKKINVYLLCRIGITYNPQCFLSFYPKINIIFMRGVIEKKELEANLDVDINLDRLQNNYLILNE